MQCAASNAMQGNSGTGDRLLTAGLLQQVYQTVGAIYNTESVVMVTMPQYAVHKDRVLGVLRL
jgi:hypothetical protein